MARRVEVLGGIPLWMRHAACRDLDSEMFFVKRGSRPTEALELCKGCPVKQNCSDYADSIGVNHGVWGGENRSRQNARKRRTQRRSNDE